MVTPIVTATPLAVNNPPHGTSGPYQTTNTTLPGRFQNYEGRLPNDSPLRPITHSGEPLDHSKPLVLKPHDGDDFTPLHHHRTSVPDDPAAQLPPLPLFQGVRPLSDTADRNKSQEPFPWPPQLPVTYPVLPPSSSPDQSRIPLKRPVPDVEGSSPLLKKQRSVPAELTTMMFRSYVGDTLSSPAPVDISYNGQSPYVLQQLAKELAIHAAIRERKSLLAQCHEIGDHPGLNYYHTELQKAHQYWGCPKQSDTVKPYIRNPKKITGYLAQQLSLEFAQLRTRDQIIYDSLYKAIKSIRDDQNAPIAAAQPLPPQNIPVSTSNPMPGAWPGSTPLSSPMATQDLFAPKKSDVAAPQTPKRNVAPSTNILSANKEMPKTKPKSNSAERPLDEPELCAEQAALVELIASGRNVFYTGSAGCGKSTVLKAFTKRLREEGKNVRIIAPTGRAALQVNGSTTWTFAGWRPDHHKRPLDQLKAEAHGKFVWKRFKETDVIVIDEISMIENLHFERLNAILKEARGTDLAFGGIQLIVTGDFCQLPPVKPFQHCITCGREMAKKVHADGTVYSCPRHSEYRDEDKWAFNSKAWAECNFEHVHLRQIHRQSDETFIKILQKCRMGERLLKEDMDLLMDHKCMVHHATKLFATRNEVNEVNTREFNKLSGQKISYWCLDEFKWQQEKHPHLQRKGAREPRGTRPPGPLHELSDHRFSDCVELKRGMLVVLLVNLDLEAGLCNGSQGIICGFEPYNPEKLPRPRKNNRDEPENEIWGDFAAFKSEQIKQFIVDDTVTNKVWPVVRFHNGLKKIIFADCSIAELGDEQPYSLLVRTQIPLAPAWAMTIHKSQSLTLDRVIVNLSRAFEEGQVYVALSRATGLHGLKIEGDREGLLAGLGGNREVQRFLRDKFGASKGLQ